MSILKNSTIKSFCLKKGTGKNDKYLIMYNPSSRFFDVYNVNAHDLVEKLEFFKTLDVEVSLFSENLKITKDMIIDRLEQELFD